MLILQRRAGQSLIIGDDIEVTVVSVDGNRVRLAISAPANIPILRNELVRAKAANVDSAHEEADPSELFGLLGGVLSIPAAEDASPHGTMTLKTHTPDESA